MVRTKIIPLKTPLSEVLGKVVKMLSEVTCRSKNGSEIVGTVDFSSLETLKFQGFRVVETAGVEPASKNTSKGLSPGAAFG